MRVKPAQYLFISIFYFLILNSANLSAFDEKGWSVEKSAHFIVYYKKAQEKFIAQTIDGAEEYYKSIANNLGFNRYEFWTWDKRAKIYIYNDAQDYQEKTGKPAWSGGHAYYHEKVIETYPWAGGFFDSLLPHELGHIIFREFIGPQSNTPYGWMKGWRCIRRKAGGRMLSSSFFRLLKKKVYEPGETIPAEYRFC